MSQPHPLLNGAWAKIVIASGNALAENEADDLATVCGAVGPARLLVEAVIT